MLIFVFVSTDLVELFLQSFEALMYLSEKEYSDLLGAGQPWSEGRRGQKAKPR